MSTDSIVVKGARVGRTYCLQCGREVKKDTVDEIAETVLRMPAGTRWNVLFPVQTAAVAVPVSSPRGADNNSSEKKKPRSKKKADEEAAAARALHTDLLKARLFELRKRGFNRLWQGGKVFEFSSPESLLDVNFNDPVYALVARLVHSENYTEVRSRLI